MCAGRVHVLPGISTGSRTSPGWNGQGRRKTETESSRPLNCGIPAHVQTSITRILPGLSDIIDQRRVSLLFADPFPSAPPHRPIRRARSTSMRLGDRRFFTTTVISQDRPAFLPRDTRATVRSDCLLFLPPFFFLLDVQPRCCSLIIEDLLGTKYPRSYVPFFDSVKDYMGYRCFI